MQASSHAPLKSLIGLRPSLVNTHLQSGCIALLRNTEELTPEGLILEPNSATAFVLSDDSNVKHEAAKADCNKKKWKKKNGRCKCKHLLRPELERFKMVRIQL